MSGHSKWHRIKRQKEVTDAKRGQAFTRLAAQIKQAARAGTDPGKNAALAEAIARAKRANMPQVNIDRLLARGEETSRQRLALEVFGPAGIALIVIAETNNPRRTITALRTALAAAGGSLGAPGSVIWKFNKSGDRYRAKYQQPLSKSTKQKLDQLLARLRQDDDIEEVFTDAV